MTSKNQDYDLFDNPMVRAASAAMSKEDKEKYKKIGEQIYGSIDFVHSTVLDNKEPPYAEAAAYICNQLRSGMHPSMLDDNEKQVMCTVFGSKWYTNWGYVEKDLTEIFTVKNSVE